MSDLTFTRSGELEVTQIEGNTEAGVEFVDAYLAPSIVVVDSGRAIVPSGEVPEIERRARERALTVSHEVTL